MVVEIERGALRRLSEIALSLGEPFVITGPSRSREISPLKPHAVVEESSWAQVEALLGEFRGSVVVAVGGGKVIDVGKALAWRAGAKLVSAPTVLSADGIASPVAVIDGSSHLLLPPHALVVDLEVVAGAPEHLTRAGAGDLAANLSATWDWRLAHREGKDPSFNGMAATLSEAGALAVVEWEGPDIRDQEFLRALAEGLLLSGFAMSLAGSSKPSSGSEHKISHALDRLYGGVGLHGEQVALASVFTTHLQGNPYRERLLGFYRALGLPTKLRDLGLSPGRFARAVVEAPGTRPDRFTVLEAKPIDEEGVLALLGPAGLV